MATTLIYAIKYVENMERAVRFHQEHLGLVLRFQSPGWSEFDTGPTTLALHSVTPEHPAGTCQLGYRVPSIDRFYTDEQNKGVVFTAPPTEVHGQRIARFKDSEGAECSVSGS